MNEPKKTVVVTGATSGIGAAAAEAFGKKGYRVLLVGRDQARGEEVAQRVRAAGGEAELLIADLFSLSEVQKLGEQIQEKAPRLEVLVNNAGGMFREKALTVDGLERTVALNVAAPFVLTEALLEPLAQAKGRVVNVVTFVPGGTKATKDELWGDKAGPGMGGYSKAKLALQALTREQQKRLGPRGITVVCFHPGVILETRFSDAMPGFMKALGPLFAWMTGFRTSLDQAASRFVRYGTEEVEPGRFYKMDTPSLPAKQAQDDGFAAEVWNHLATLKGGAFRAQA